MSKWITRERPKIDRIACPWLIKRFVDPDAEFIYVPKEKVFDKAFEMEAIRPQLLNITPLPNLRSQLSPEPSCE